MSIIQRIRDKGALISAIVIALALLGFILMDAFAGRTGVGGSSSSTVGKINGHKVDYNSFNYKVQAYQERGGGGENAAQQAIEEAWKAEIDSVLLTEQFDELGLSVTDKEINDILFGANPPQDLRQRFTDSATGQYNAREAQQFVNQLKKSSRAEEKDQLAAYIQNQHNTRLVEKFTALFTNTAYYPDWYLQKRNANNSIISKVSFVAVPYSTIPDSSVKVSDDEIDAYVREHRKLFEQKEETRSISYVLFSARPTAADSAAARAQLMELRPVFDTVTQYTTFIQKNSTLPYYDGYISKENIQNPNKDSILSGPVGASYGPYLDEGQPGQPSQLVLSKIVDVKTIPDTVKVRHILVSLYQQDPNTGQRFQIRDEASAKKLIDSVQGLLQAGQSFDSLVLKFSEDPGSKNTGGVYENVVSGRMVPTFNDFIFTGKTGDIGVVKTDYGYHLVEIMSQTGSAQGYKIAYLARPVISSPDTENEAQNAANMFAGDSRDLKSFNENWEKNLRNKGINKMQANDIMPMSWGVQGITGANRRFVKAIFEADKGDIVGPERIGDDYIVAVVTEVNKAGLQNASRARMVVEPVLRNKKKAEMIRKNIGQVTTLEAVASKMGQQIQTVDSVRFAGGSMISFENKIVGAAANMANNGKVITEPISGQQGVYVVRVDYVGTTPVEAANLDMQRAQLEAQARQMMSSQMQYGNHPLLDPLKRAAKIKDYRSEFF
ncbi:MAG TPA: peptidylprolyl isomerase [Flavisolibacter sp.]